MLKFRIEYRLPDIDKDAFAFINAEDKTQALLKLFSLYDYVVVNKIEEIWS